ncbi:glutamate racemase [Faunimonas pinastri]|uniref:Glutamate racemase n=1 Tax=Faunimonas pinastri TaxID=1855383 RepID=A0A1H9D435_9HYPH|nr:glutamate racemase [Faunimonas pinastri]SEQ08117.1 glutamate racemase [Faunimonas pinastri]
MADTPKPILIFDSGVGGLSVLRAIRNKLPEQDLVYVADDAAFPYGNWEEGALVQHIVELMGGLIARHDPQVLVIACNTASTIVLPPLRERFAIPFVGTVPAIKPAAEQTQSGVVAVLGTPGAMKRDYTRQLISDFAQSCHVRLVGSPDLAALAEAHLRGEAVDRDLLRSQIEPCFFEMEGRRSDIVVLACTHYPFLVDLMTEIAPWPVGWLDPAPAIARRVGSLVPPILGRSTAPDGKAFFTAHRPVSAPLMHVLEGYGLHLMEAA